MQIALPRGLRASVEHSFRATFKNFLLNDSGRMPGPLPVGRFGTQRVLPPHLGEMGAEIRYHLARAEPWLCNGWKIVTRRPAFYPKGTTFDAPEFFAQLDGLLAHFGVVQGYGAFCIVPVESGTIGVEQEFTGKRGALTFKLSDLTIVMLQAQAEIELRKLFLEWFYFEGRTISDYDRFVLSFNSGTAGNWEYSAAAALRPGFLPPAFEDPPEAAPPHVGVQMRRIEDGQPQARNSDPEWMMATARALAEHLDVPLIGYGHPKGCHIPDGVRTTFEAARPQGQLERELGYLKSCRVMLSPDSGWTDLMGWLEIPTMLEKQVVPGEFEPLRAGFCPRIQLVDRRRSISEQCDALLAADGPTLPPTPPKHLVESRLFPWEP